MDSKYFNACLKCEDFYMEDHVKMEYDKGFRLSIAVFFNDEYDAKLHECYLKLVAGMEKIKTQHLTTRHWEIIYNAIEKDDVKTIEKYVVNHLDILRSCGHYGECFVARAILCIRPTILKFLVEENLLDVEDGEIRVVGYKPGRRHPIIRCLAWFYEGFPSSIDANVDYNVRIQSDMSFIMALIMERAPKRLIKYLLTRVDLSFAEFNIIRHLITISYRKYMSITYKLLLNTSMDVVTDTNYDCILYRVIYAADRYSQSRKKGLMYLFRGRFVPRVYVSNIMNSESYEPEFHKMVDQIYDKEANAHRVLTLRSTTIPRLSARVLPPAMLVFNEPNLMRMLHAFLE
jgi:hypothetical protein